MPEEGTCLSNGETPTVAVMCSAVKRNEDIGMGHLGLNRRDIYGKSVFFLKRYAQINTLAYLQPLPPSPA